VNFMRILSTRGEADNRGARNIRFGLRFEF
jgi:hypothetical protein